MTEDQKAKYRDARWQQKRLRIYERDSFTCQHCGKGPDDSIELNGHHIAYEAGKCPWEYLDHQLITLCQPCHEKEHSSLLGGMKALQQELRGIGFMLKDFRSLADHINENFEHDGRAGALEFMRQLKP